MMKSFKFLPLSLSVIFVILVAGCSNNIGNTNSLVGKTYYILHGEINSADYASLQETKMEFINDSLIEASKTVYADALGYNIIDDSASGTSKMYKYSYENGIFQLPAYNIVAKLEKLNNGDIRTNEGEYFYQSSIVKLLGTDQAYQRLAQDSKLPMPGIFKSFLLKPSTSLITMKNGMIEFNQDLQSSSQEKQKYDLETEYNDLLATVDSIQENDDTFLNNNEDVLNIINKLKEKIRNELTQESFDGIAAKKDITKFKQLINSLIKPRQAYTKGTIEYTNKPKAIFHGERKDSLEDSNE